MSITISLPHDVEAQLRAEVDNLDEVAKLGLAVEAYRNMKLSLGQFADLLGISQYKADGILKDRNVSLAPSEAELAAEREALQRLLGT